VRCGDAGDKPERLNRGRKLSGILLDGGCGRIYVHFNMSTRLFIALCLATLALQSVKAEEPPINITIGIQRMEGERYQIYSNYALAFGIQNVGTNAIAGGRLKGSLAKGIVHTLPTGGQEHTCKVGPEGFIEYGLVPNDLPPGESWGDTVSNSDFMWCLAKDGDYHLWWTLGGLKSNVLHLTATNGIIQVITSDKSK
jgi:hypothetical protein